MGCMCVRMHMLSIGMPCRGRIPKSWNHRQLGATGYGCWEPNSVLCTLDSLRRLFLHLLFMVLFLVSAGYLLPCLSLIKAETQQIFSLENK